MYLFFIAVLLFNGISCTVVIPKVQLSDCGANQYFQFSSLRCVACSGSFQQKSVDSLSCTCNQGSRIFTDFGGHTKSCQPCLDQEVVTSDGWSCVKCEKDTDYISATKTCKPCNAGSISVDKDQYGTRLSRKICVTCTGLSTPGSSERVCKRCNQQILKATSETSCSCTGPGLVEAGGVCFTSTTSIPRNLPSSFSVDYHGLGKVSSAFFKQHFRLSKGLCLEHGNFTACQLLGNLCVLLMYTSVGLTDNACNEYTKTVNAPAVGGKPREYVQGIKDWPVEMPWLYYSDYIIEVLDKTNIDDVYTRAQSIEYTLASYSPTGQFLGISNDVSILQLCPTISSIAEAAVEFTTTYTKQCKLKVSKLLQMDSVFFDLFLHVNDNKGLYPIPVLVDNYQNKGSFVNRETNRANWKVNRRFFLVDHFSGRTSFDKPVTHIQYASSVELVYRLQTDGKIFPPLLKIKYEGAMIADLASKQSEVSVSFKVSYEMETTVLEKNIEIAVGVLSGLAIVYSLLRIIGWRRREGLLLLDCTSCMYYIIFSCSALVVVFLAVLFVSCIQWLLFFKRQTTVIRVLPTNQQETLIKALLVAAFVMKTLDIIYLLYSQIYIDIFFIDWERPRGSVSVNMQAGEGKAVASPVSIMRTLFVANEWREIQTVRRIKPTLQVILVALFFNAIGLEHWTTTDPFTRVSVDTSSQHVGDVNLSLRLGVICLLFFVIAIIQWVLFGFIYERFVGDAIGDFIDFCSMSNISVFLMSHAQFGYYIHGRSVHGRSDTSMHELYEQFQREEDNLCGKRGLEPNTDLQTFEMALTMKFRKDYSKIVQPMLRRDTQGVRRGQPPQARQNPSLPGSALPPGLEQSVRAYNSINKYLASFIEHAIRENDYSIKDKLLLEKLLRVELQRPTDKTVLYNDDGRSFTTILLYGQEWSLLIFDLLVYLMVDWMSGWNSILAAIVTYFADIFIVIVRDTLGKKNIARKTMMDERFLI